MAQDFTIIQSTDTLAASLPVLLENLVCLMSDFSGTTFPTLNINVGMTCNRTDQSKVYRLVSTGPAVWTLVEDYGKTFLSQEGADARYHQFDVAGRYALKLQSRGASTNDYNNIDFIDNAGFRRYSLIRTIGNDLIFQRYDAAGTFIENSLQISNDGTVKILGSQVWHAGNDGSGSGLDADVLRSVTPSAPSLVLLAATVYDALPLTDVTTNDVSISKHGFAPKLPNDATKFLNGVGQYAVPAYPTVPPSFQCELIKNGSNLQLTRNGGQYIFIAGVWVPIPATGPTLAPTGATPGTLYYIYAYMSGATLTLEYDTTVPVISTTYGHMIKTGDGSRSLVGQARPITGPAWVNTTAQRFVRSYYNRNRVAGSAVLTADRSLAAFSGLVEIHTEIRNEFLIWAGEAVSVNAQGTTYNNSTNRYNISAIGIDGAASVARSSFDSLSANTGVGFGIGYHSVDLAQGYHYATLMGDPGDGTGYWVAGDTAYPRATACSLMTAVH